MKRHNINTGLYTTLVRPHPEYAAPVWDSSTANNINKLEDTQKFALRICTRQWNMGYQDLPKLTFFGIVVYTLRCVYLIT